MSTDPWLVPDEPKPAGARPLLIGVLAVFLVCALVIGYLWYFLFHRRAYVDSIRQDDYRAEFVTVGNFRLLGATDVEVVIYHDGTPVNTLEFTIHHYGDHVTSENWTARFEDDHVVVRLAGSKQVPYYCTLYFDGRQDCYY